MTIRSSLSLICTTLLLIIKNIESVYTYHQTHEQDQNRRKLSFQNWNSTTSDVYNSSECHVTRDTGSVYPITDDGNIEIGRLQYNTRIQGNRMEIGAVEMCISNELAEFEPSYEKLIPMTVSWPQLKADPIIEADEYTLPTLTIGEPTTVPTSILNTPPIAIDIEQDTSIPTEVTNQLVSPSPTLIDATLPILPILKDDDEEAKESDTISETIESEAVSVSDGQPTLLTASPSSQEETKLSDMMGQMENLLGFGVKETTVVPSLMPSNTLLPSLKPSNATSPLEPALAAITEEEQPEEEGSFYENPAAIAGAAAATAAVGGAAFLAKGAMDGTGALASMANKPPDVKMEMNNDKGDNNKKDKKKKKKDDKDKKDDKNKEKDDNNVEGEESEFELEFSSDEEKEEEEEEEEEEDEDEDDDDDSDEDSDEEEERPALTRQKSYRNVMLDPKLAKKKGSVGSRSTKKKKKDNRCGSSITTCGSSITTENPRTVPPIILPPITPPAQQQEATNNDTSGPSIPSGNSLDEDSDNVSVKSEPNVPDLRYFLSMGFLDVTDPGGSDCTADDMV